MNSDVDGNLYGVFGFSGNDVFAVGDNGTVIHWTGTKWLTVSIPSSESFRAVWGLHSSDLWVAGENGTLLRWNGAIWMDHSVSVSSNLHAISGNILGDIAAAGDDGCVVIYEANQWRTEHPGPTSVFRAIAITEDRTVIVTDETGRIFQRQDGEWNEMKSCTDNSLSILSSAETGHLYAGGEGGTLIVLAPDIPDPTSTPEPALPTPTPSVTPTCSATPSACELTSVELHLPSIMFHSGDSFFLHATICNASPAPLPGYPLFVVLDVYGDYFFAPSFGTMLDYYGQGYDNWSPGLTQLIIVPQFFWPADAGRADGIRFIGALVSPDLSEIIGAMTIETFGWTDR